MKCPKCNSDLPDKAKFCLECGSNISAVSSQSGIEAENSLGDFKTMAAKLPADGDLSVGDLRTMPRHRAPDHPERSIGDLKTMQSSGTTDCGSSTISGIPLSDRYELLDEIGRGGFARVWKGRDRKLDRMVAVKRLLMEELKGAVGEQTLARFQREAQAIANLNHRNIVAVYDHDRDAEGDYIVMEYVDGGTLRDWLKAQEGKIEVPRALELARGIAQGLAHAHRKNLVHRDIKPANILLHKDGEELTPKIVDFGLARAGSESELSMTGYGMGTPWYMPPEQRRDAKSVNHTADIYALGKVLYELVSGEVPDNVDPEKIPPLAGLSEVVFKCIKSNPEERYFSADEVLTALEGVGGRAVRAQAMAQGGENICPACNAANEADVKFCENCGTGLTRLCPECDRENSIHKQFCGGCGTDVEGFVKWQEALPRLEKHTAEKRWSRVVKEYDLLPKELKLAGEKGKGVRRKVDALNEDAQKRLARMEELKAEADKATASGAWRERENALTEYIDLNPRDENASKALEETQRKIDEEDWAQALAAAEKHEDAAEFRKALAELEGYLKAHAEGGHAEEAAQHRKRLENVLSMDDQRIARLRAADFDGVAEIIARMEPLLRGNAVAVRLKEENEEQREACSQAIKQAQKLTKARKLEEAAAAWQEIAGRWPESDQIKNEVASIRETRTKVEALVKESRNHLSAGRLREALKAAQAARSLSPRGEDVGKVLAATQSAIRRVRRKRKAKQLVMILLLIAAWFGARHVAHEHNKAIVRSAVVLAEKGHFQDAIDTYKRATAIDMLMVDRPEFPAQLYDIISTKNALLLQHIKELSQANQLTEAIEGYHQMFDLPDLMLARPSFPEEIANAAERAFNDRYRAISQRDMSSYEIPAWSEALEIMHIAPTIDHDFEGKATMYVRGIHFIEKAQEQLAVAIQQQRAEEKLRQEQLRKAMRSIRHRYSIPLSDILLNQASFITLERTSSFDVMTSDGSTRICRIYLRLDYKTRRAQWDQGRPGPRGEIYTGYNAFEWNSRMTFWLEIKGYGRSPEGQVVYNQTSNPSQTQWRRWFEWKGLRCSGSIFYSDNPNYQRTPYVEVAQIEFIDL